MDIILVKSPIILRKMPFSKLQKSDKISAYLKIKKSAINAEVLKMVPLARM